MQEELKIGIIDDEDAKLTRIATKIRTFSSKLSEEKSKYYNFTLNPVAFELTKSVDGLIEQIKQTNIDVVIVDYFLGSSANVSYNGVCAAREILENFSNFPIFVLTGYEEQLYEKELFDAYQVFNYKRYTEEDKEALELHTKLIEQTLKTRKQREIWIDELKALMPRMGESAEIDAKILELDANIEKSIDKKHMIPIETKKKLEDPKLDELISKIDKILEG